VPDTVDLRHLIKQCSECGQRFSPEAVFCPFDGAKLGDVSPTSGRVDPLLGQTLDGRYAIESVVGEGGMGTVYRARHVALGRALAVKVLRAEFAEEAELGERFLQEAQATAAVKHPNVVSITDFGRLPDGHPYYVMELLSGRTLAKLIDAGGALPPHLAARVAVDIASGLAAAHAARVVHRDLKPDNVFLVGPQGDETKELRVVDFGAAVVLGRSRLTKKGIVFGTPHYMSPEQASGHAVDHRSDIYALGIVLYEMVTGRVPFEGDTYMGVLTQHMYAAPTPPTKLSPRLARELGPLEPVILRALEKEPEARHATMDAFAGAITEALGRAAGPAPSWPAPQSPSQRAPRGIADELELPSLAELRGSVERASSAPPARSRAVRRAAWLGALGVLAAGSAAFALSALRHTQAAPTETAIVATAPPSQAQAPPPPPSQAPTQPPAPPQPSAIPSETAAHPPLVRRPKAASKAPTAPGLGPDPFLSPH